VPPIHVFHVLSSTAQAKQVIFKLIVCGLASTAQTIFAFTFLAMVSAVTYSVANVTKRVCIIAVSAIVFQNPISAANAFGIALSMVCSFIQNGAFMWTASVPLLTPPPSRFFLLFLFTVRHCPLQQGQAERKGQSRQAENAAASGYC
jgi:multidrug transporter EmrE-like cation transporter